MQITEVPGVEKLREELGEIADYVENGYTLADAMREGSKVTRQHKNGWYGQESACALAAARIAVEARKV